MATKNFPALWLVPLAIGGAVLLAVRAADKDRAVDDATRERLGRRS